MGLFAAGLAVVFGSAANAFATGENAAAASDGSAAAIARMEHDLLPLTVIEGKPVPAVTIQQRMAFYHVPGVSIAVVDKDRIAWTRQYGVTDMATGRPVTAATIFQASSITKVITALATLRLVRDGRLTLDEDVNRQLTSWKVPDTDFTRTEKVTVRRLLSHDAGVTVHGFSGYAPGAALPTTLQILMGAPPANSPPITTDKPPGSGFRYSGGGYVILQQLIEDVTGEPFAKAVDQMVLAPAGMTRSVVAQPLPKSLKGEAAVGHADDGSPLPGGSAIFPEEGPAGLWSTPTDLARLAIEVDRELSGEADGVLDRSLAQQMLTRQAGDWGLGVDLGTPGKEQSFSHNGANPGFQSYLIYYPKRHQGVAVMTNGASQSGLAYEIAAAVARQYGWPDWDQSVRKTVSVDPAILAKYRGTWLADGAPEFQVGVKEGHLYIQGGPFGQEPVELYATAPTSFFILSTGFRFDFDPAKPNAAVLAGGISAVRTGPSKP